MKKRISLLLVVVMVLAMALTGCGQKAADNNAGSGDGPKVAFVFALGGLGDKGFNDSAMEGLEMAKEQLGATIQYVEPKETAEFEGHLREFAKDGSYDVVFGFGYDQVDAIQVVAKEFPEQKFAIIDGEVDGYDNIMSVTFNDPEKAFLLGTIAGKMTKTNKVGMVGGMDIPLINGFGAGLKSGMAYVNPDVELSIKYVGAFNDANTGKELARALYDEGCDIVMACAGGSGLGVFAAAKDVDKMALGADVNQIPLDPDHIVASAMRMMQTVVLDIIGSVKDGSYKGGHQMRGLKEKATDVTVEGAVIKTPQEVLDRTEEIRQELIDGKIDVPTTLDEAEAFIKDLKK
nr:BMP family ABC transporter substrate-binding protein [Maliibacterium massiliense]